MTKAASPDNASLYRMTGALIKELRVSRRMSGEILGGLLGISQQQISRYERGESKLTLNQINNISYVFNMSLWEFMEILRFFCEENK
ncbi:TPA: helix-turn-helix transcriptional regulator [Morganella morganii]|nr:helix-turn-helix transcriptional regulator [Morganella morganii]